MAGGLPATADPRPNAHPLFLPKPLIAAVNGSAAGIGLVDALYCDVRFVAEEARLTTAFARRGLAAEGGISWLLPRVVGRSRALDLLLSGRTFNSRKRVGSASRTPCFRPLASSAPPWCTPATWRPIAHPGRWP